MKGTQAVELTPRVCRWCKKTYVCPKGNRWAGCKTCCPTIEDVIANVAFGRDVPDISPLDARPDRGGSKERRAEPQHDGIPY